MQCLKHGTKALLAVIALIFSGHAGADTGSAVYLLPVVDGSEETRSTPFIAWFEDLSSVGYVEEEYLLAGEAAVYGYSDTVESGSDIEVVVPAMPYRTRLIVRRPETASHFNGTVYVEILNATAGWDGDPTWQNTHDYMMRNGGAYVGITSKPVSVDFLRDQWGTSSVAAKRDRSRYASLKMPHFGQVWDVITDTLTLLRAEGNGSSLLNGFEVTRVILVGYSQSVAFQVTYANHFHQSALVSGYFLAGGGEHAKRINRLDSVEELASGHVNNKISVSAPVVRFQTQTEVVGFGAYRVRQHEPDNAAVRIYEMAGGAHVDVVTAQLGAKTLTRDLALSSYSNGCELAINPLRIGTVQSALLDVLNQWIDGEPPPKSKMIELDPQTEEMLLDSAGNAIGGLRPPALSAPLGQYLGSNRGGGFCFLIGGFVPFNSEELLARYGNKVALVDRYRRAINESVRDRFLLPGDASILIRELARDLTQVWPTGALE